jgi:maltose-binding protein MalE
LDSLSTTSAAAPLGLPDLIALPRNELETAATSGLLQPFDDLTQAIDDPDWYEYARQLAHLQNNVFGLPFAGDALALVYRSSVIAAPPSNWSKTLEGESSLVFPAADPRALFTLMLYQANGGATWDDQGLPYLDTDILSEVLAFYLEAEQNDIMPYWLTQYQDYNQVWETYTENHTDMTAAWTTHYLTNVFTDTQIAPIPTPGGTPFTLATGWVWALASPQEDRHELSTQLAVFLIDSTYLAGWTKAAGYLPTRPSALDAWTGNTPKENIGKIAASAQLIPSADLLNSLGPPLQQATVQVLKEQNDPLSAAQTAAKSLIWP